MTANEETNGATNGARWTIVIHGGAGTIGRKDGPEREREYLDALARALKVGQDILAQGGTSLDAVEQVVRTMEDDPHFNAGKGAAYTREGKNELDASIMDGRNLATGAVAAVRHVKHPISLSRRIMEDGEHVLMAGTGAEEYARGAGLEMADDEYFRTEERYRRWRRAAERDAVGSEAGEVEKGTVGAVALDIHGNLAAATSTGGLTNKLPGRIGDSPLAGIGTYADNGSCAISCTGNGEEFIRLTVAFRIAALMRYGGRSLRQAADEVVSKTLSPDSGGIIAVDREGNAVMPFNTRGMNRGAADSTGRFEVAIW